MNPARVLQIATDVELLAGEVLADRQEIVDLDRRRNANREALRAAKEAKSRTVWTCFSNTFVKFAKSDLEAMLKKDQKTLDAGIKRLRDELPGKVDELRKLQAQKAAQGFSSLAALAKDEVKVATL
eukprot:m.2014 g.2014  ORF g.2014 m.2014 type:complete len:126 (+) comp8176_c0_seq1:67-444(+)